jgi:hypothetical protein
LQLYGNILIKMMIVPPNGSLRARAGLIRAGIGHGTN